MPKSRTRKKAAQDKKTARRAAHGTGQEAYITTHEGYEIPARLIPNDPQRGVGLGPTYALPDGTIFGPEVVYTDDRVEAALTARGWTSDRPTDGTFPPEGDMWSFQPLGGDILAPSRAIVTVDATHITASPGTVASSIPERNYTTLHDLLADIDVIEAWPAPTDDHATP